MQNRCPFLMGHACYGGTCMMWRASANGGGYCGVGGAPAEVAFNPSQPLVPAIDVPAIVVDKKTPNGASSLRQKR